MASQEGRGQVATSGAGTRLAAPGGAGGDPGPVLTGRARRKLPLFAVVVLGLAVAMTGLTIFRLQALSARLPGVVTSKQLAPFAHQVVFSIVDEFGARAPGDPSSTDRDAVRKQAKDELRSRLASLSRDVSVDGWWQNRTSLIVVGIAEVDGPGAVAASLDRTPVGALQATRAWAEGDRFVVVVGVAGANGEQAEALAEANAHQVKGWTEVARASWLVTSALGPAVAVIIFYGLVTFASLLVQLALLLVRAAFFLVIRLPLILLTRGRAGGVRGSRTGPPKSNAPLPGVADHVRIVRLDGPSGWRAGWRGTTLWSVLGLAFALPALTPAFWPSSIIWTAAVGLFLLPGSLSLEGSGAKRLRWFVVALMAAGSANALFGVGPRNRTANLAVAVTILVLGLIALVSFGRRTWGGSSLEYASKRSDLAPRSTAYLVGGLGLLLASMCLFLGSNGDPNPVSQLLSKGIAVLGLAAVPVVARRYRAAKDAAQRAWARENDVSEVLLLRSFVDDDLGVRSQMRDRAGLERFALRWNEPFEDVIVRAVETLGPVVAIAKPGTREGEFGAARDRILVADWLSAVKAAMQESLVIVAILGRGEGLRSEFATLAELDLLGRVCLVVPPIDTTDASARLATATSVMTGPDGWGTIQTDRTSDGQVLALVGEGADRFVLMTSDRNSVSAYMQLGRWLSDRPPGRRGSP